MKKYLFIFAALLPILSGCRKQASVEPQVNDFSQKLSLPAAGKTVWNEGDVICLNGHLSAGLTAGGSSEAEFTFPGYSLAEGSIVNVLCGGDSSACHFTIPSGQTFENGTDPAASSPLWGSSVAGTPVSLHNVCSFIDLRLGGSGEVASLVLKADGREFIAGEYELGYSSGAFNGAFTGGSSTALKISFKQPLTVTSDSTRILVPVPAGSYSAGFTACIYNASGRYMTVDILPDGALMEADRMTGVSIAYTPDRASESLGDYDENPLFDSGSLYAGTFNILNSTGRSGCPANTWDAAKASVASIIMNMDCDVMTLNELGSTEISYLKSTLSGYSFVTRPNSDKGTYSYAPGIIYRSTRFEKLDDGIFWTSDPDAQQLVTAASAYSYVDPVDSAVYTASSMRCCVWAHFRDNESGKTFWWFATHPHIRGNDSGSSLFNTIHSLNAGNIRSLLKQIPYLNTSDEPMVVAGDMNSWSQYVSYPLFGGAGLLNAFEESVRDGTIDSDTAVRPGTCPGTTPSSYNYTESHRIDHIFYKGFKAGAYRNVYTKYYNSAEGCTRHPSDHIPAKVKLTIIN